MYTQAYLHVFMHTYVIEYCFQKIWKKKKNAIFVSLNVESMQYILRVM